MLLFIFAMMGGMTAQNTYVHVTIFLNDGTEASYDMQNASYMYFEEGVKLVITEGSDGMDAVSYPLANIRKITCEEVVGTLENTTIGVSLYPNPTHAALQVGDVNALAARNLERLYQPAVKGVDVDHLIARDVADLQLVMGGVGVK